MNLELWSGVVVFGIVALAAAGAGIGFVQASTARARQSRALAGALVVFPLSVAWIAVFVGVLETTYLAGVGLALIVGLTSALLKKPTERGT